jgi:drug/metabolite transporter (DMT)-like permease
MQANRRSAHTQSALAAVLGVALVSPDGLIITAFSANVATTLAIRAVFISIGCLVVIKLRTGKVFRSTAWALGRNGVAFAVFNAAGSILFVSSLHRTSVAHTLFIAAAVPALTGVMGRFSRADSLPRRTWVTAIGVLVGVGLLVASAPGSTHLVGDLEALGAAVLLSAGLLVVPRSDDGRVTGAQVLAVLLSSAVVLPWLSPGTATGKDLLLSLAFFLVLMPAGTSLILGSRRHLAAVDVSLLLLLESVLGPLWAWLGLGQRPDWQTAVAGAIILTCVAAHTVAGRQPGVSFST